MKYFFSILIIFSMVLQTTFAFDFSNYNRKNPAAVRALQEFLTMQGYNPGDIDGVSGPKTMKALRQFQSDKKIKKDGIVGPETSDEIHKIQPPTSQQKQPTTDKTSTKPFDPNSNTSSKPTPETNNKDCEKGSGIVGNTNHMKGCGSASTYGHDMAGGPDSYVHSGGGDTFCRVNRQGGEQFVYKANRPHSENLKTCVVALKKDDIARIFNIDGVIGEKNETKKNVALGKNRKKFCGKMIKITDTKTGKSAEAALYDIMSNRVKPIIDLSGCVMRELTGQKSGQTTKNGIMIEWSNKATPPHYKH